MLQIFTVIVYCLHVKGLGLFGETQELQGGWLAWHLDHFSHHYPNSFLQVDSQLGCELGYR
jgi:hypothetical protein